LRLAFQLQTEFGEERLGRLEVVDNGWLRMLQR
jgi:hypothetical protein